MCRYQARSTAIHTYQTQHISANSSSRVPPVPAASPTGIAQRTNCYLVFFFAANKVSPRCPGAVAAATAAAPAAVAAAAAAVVSALHGELDFALAAAGNNQGCSRVNSNLTGPLGSGQGNLARPMRF